MSKPGHQPAPATSYSTHRQPWPPEATVGPNGSSWGQTPQIGARGDVEFGLCRSVQFSLRLAGWPDGGDATVTIDPFTIARLSFT